MCVAHVYCEIHTIRGPDWPAVLFSEKVRAHNWRRVLSIDSYKGPSPCALEHTSYMEHVPLKNLGGRVEKQRYCLLLFVI